MFRVNSVNSERLETASPTPVCAIFRPGLRRDVILFFGELAPRLDDPLF